MDQYAEVIGSDASVDDYLRMASHFRKNNEHFKAGEFFFKADVYDKVFKYTSVCNYSKFIVCNCRLCHIFFAAPCLCILMESISIWQLK